MRWHRNQNRGLSVEQHDSMIMNDTLSENLLRPRVDVIDDLGKDKLSVFTLVDPRPGNDFVLEKLAVHVLANEMCLITSSASVLTARKRADAQSTILSLLPRSYPGARTSSRSRFP
jgi:hypothetical protein